MSHFGSDRDIALAAWTSTVSEMTPEREARVHSFVVSLAKEKHTVPFEHTYLRFMLHTDIATHIHFLKHRIGVSVSSQSFRWKEQDVYGYTPSDWDDESIAKLLDFQTLCFNMYHNMISTLTAKGMPRKRAKETARYFLPYSTMIHYEVSMNFHSFAHFANLRADEHAQLEVRELCLDMLHQVKDTNVFNAALEGWGLNRFIELKSGV